MGPASPGASTVLSYMPWSSAISANLQSESPFKRRPWQYFIAALQLTSLPLSLAAHIRPVDGSTQTSRFRLSCAAARSGDRVERITAVVKAISRNAHLVLIATILLLPVAFVDAGDIRAGRGQLGNEPKVKFRLEKRNARKTVF